MSIESCIPVIPSEDLEISLRFWSQGLGFNVDPHGYDGDKMIGCMLRKGKISCMLNIRDGAPEKPEHYEGVRFYWNPTDIHEIRNRLKALGFDVSDIVQRDYGQTEFSLTDDDGFSHCFGVPTTAYQTGKK